MMDYDTPNEVWVPGRHKVARNIIFKGEPGNLRGEKIPGNRKLNFTPPAGNNVNIGRFWDPVQKRVFFFNYNSNGNSGVYIINDDESIVTLIQDGTNTTGIPLSFTADGVITSVDIFYGDDNTGDILYFLDSLKRPTKINIKSFLAGTYNPIIRSYIDVAKAPPQMPIKPVYENDADVTSNQLRNILFQFSYRFVYDDNEKSVWSQYSIVPLPFQPYTTLTQDDYHLNSRISLFMSTGPSNVKKIEVSFRYVKDGILSPWYLISSFDKAALGLTSNDVFWYKFYNSDNYIPVDPLEQRELQSMVPQEAAAQSLINGNVLAYTNIKEGYNIVNANTSVNSPTESGNTYFFDYNGLLFFATISGVDSGVAGTRIKIYVAGTGTNVSGTVSVFNNSAAYYKINMVDGAGADKSISYLESASVQTVNAVLAAVSGLLVAEGFTQVSLVDNVLIVSYPTAITLYSSGTSTTGTGFASPVNAATTKFSYAFQSAYTFGQMYFDEAGRTNGAVIAAGGTFQTALDNGSQNMSPQLVINQRPPKWARSWVPVRTPNLTYSKRLNWVTNGAYSDAQANILGVRYAYLEIDNIRQYNELIHATEGVVSYGFTPGDRVRISGRFAATGAPATLNATYDYEVLGVVNSFVVDGITKIGTFVQIYYPTADIDANFKFDGAGNFQNYQILLYSLAKHQNATNQIYFECGKAFGIGNPGTDQAYHIGLEQTQSADLVTPAKVTLANGDMFARQRVVFIGRSAVLSAVPIGNGFYYVRPELTIPTTITNAVYTLQAATGAQANPPLVPSYDPAANFFLNNSVNPITVRLRASIPITVDLALNASVLATISTPGPVEKVITLVNPIAMSPSVGYTVEVDSYVTVPPSGYLNMLLVNSANVVNMNIGSYSLTVDVILNVTIPIIETSFSDVYNMMINSNGRPSVYDPNAKQVTDGVLFRYSRPYDFGTNFNGMSMFYPLNYDRFDDSFGPVIRTRINQNELRVFQKVRVGRVGIYARFIKNNAGDTTLITSDTIITPNNIEYYIGDFGLSIPSSLVSNGNVDYFPAINKGVWVRLSQDGMTPISEIYHMQTWAGNVLPAYNTDTAYQYGGIARIWGTFNYLKDRHGEVIFSLQGGGSKVPYALSFDEKENAFSSFYDFQSEAIQSDNIVCAGNKLITWQAGIPYVHDDVGTNRRFYGSGFFPSIDLVFNDNPNVKKEFTTVGYASPIQSQDLSEPSVPLWDAPVIGDIYTALNQQSNLIYGDFEARENMYYAAFWRAAVYSNVYNVYDVWSGDYLKGLWLQMHLRCGTYGATHIFSPFVNYLVSPKVL